MRLIYLARELKRIREEAGVSRDEVVDATGISQATMSRIEKPATSIKPDVVEILLQYYGGSAEELAALKQLASEASQRGWWDQYRGTFKGAFVGLEQQADELFAFEPLLIPGLLQTKDYARAIFNASPSARKDETVEARIQGRLARQALVGRPDPPNLHYVLGEAALRQKIGGQAVMRGQLIALWGESRRPNVTVHVIPFAAGAHFGLDGTFTLFTYNDFGMQIGFSEGPGGQVYLESAAALAELNLRRDGVLSAALSPEQSAVLIREVADTLRE